MKGRSVAYQYLVGLPAIDGLSRSSRFSGEQAGDIK